MYWIDFGQTHEIVRSGMDGENREIIIGKEDGLYWPNGLAIGWSLLHTVLFILNSND